MKIRTENLNWNGIVIPKVELEFLSIKTDFNGKSGVFYKVYHVLTGDVPVYNEDGEQIGVEQGEIIKYLTEFNVTFEYTGGDIRLHAIEHVKQSLGI